MPPAFILRFQEACASNQTVAAAGDNTLSITAVHAEAADTDVERDAFSALPLQAGSETMTKTQGEHTDADRDLWAAKVIPFERRDFFLMTQTITNVRAESVDTDPDGRRFHAIP